MSNVSVSKLSDGTNIGYIASQSYFECSTAASTSAKEATSPNNVTFSDTSLVSGVTVHVKFTNTNTASSPTLKIGTSTAKAIYKTASATAGTTPVTSWAAGSIISFTYNGTNWVVNGYVPAVGTVSVNSTTLSPDTNGQVDITSQVNALINAKISGDDATAGDILSGKKAHVNGTQVTGTISSKAAATYNVSSSNQTISANQYLSGAQTIRGVTTSGISAANIAYGVTVKVGDAGDDDRIIGVTGTYTTIASGGATSAKILSGYSAYVNGQLIQGSITTYDGTVVTS